jgi:hypothetical protein
MLGIAAEQAVNFAHTVGFDPDNLLDYYAACLAAVGIYRTFRNASLPPESDAWRTGRSSRQSSNE